MLCLGLEGTAHTSAVGIVDDSGRILADERDMYRPANGGIHPREAANHHVDFFPDIIERAVNRAGIDYDDIDLIAFSIGPGLGPCLRSTATAARSLAISLRRPILGVNHCVAHMEIGRLLTDAEDPLMLYVSGGNTQVAGYHSRRYRIYGETIDVGIGNMLDKFGIAAGLGFYAGPEIERLAGMGRELLSLPYSVKGMDVAFSGILTAAKQHLSRGRRIEDICFSLQETAFSMVSEVAERAMAHTEKCEILTAGGVARNRRLFGMLSEMAKCNGWRAFEPPSHLLADNGVMIAWNGILAHGAGGSMKIDETEINQRYRTDMVDITWRE